MVLFWLNKVASIGVRDKDGLTQTYMYKCVRIYIHTNTHTHTHKYIQVCMYKYIRGDDLIFSCFQDCQISLLYANVCLLLLRQSKPKTTVVLNILQNNLKGTACSKNMKKA